MIKNWCNTDPRPPANDSALQRILVPLWIFSPTIGMDRSKKYLHVRVVVAQKTNNGSGFQKTKTPQGIAGF